MLLRYIAKRLLQTAGVILIVTILAFLLVRLAPGNPARLMLPETATEEQVKMMEEYLGLDKPLIIQYGKYLSDMLHGDFGTSFSYNLPVKDLIAERIGYTMKLTLYVTIFAVILCVPLGIIARSEERRVGKECL